MTDAETSAATLRAKLGAPLADPAVRRVVESTAVAIAERQGVEVVEVVAGEDEITVRVRGPRLAAIGLVAELRRLTNRWHEGKYGGSLWDEDGHP